MAGREVLRRATLDSVHGTGSPTTVLFPADVVRAHTPFFDETMYHSDTDAALRTLQHADYGFVHRTLTFSRLHPDTITASFADRVNTYPPLLIRMLARYGRQALTPQEYRRGMRLRLRQYGWFLAKARLRSSRRSDQSFQEFHRSEISRALAELPADDRETRRVLQVMRALFTSAGPGRKETR
jgi:hypothetical protein